MKTITQKINTNQSSLVRILIFIVSALVISYLYFINSISFTTASYEKVITKISYIQSEISELESSVIRSAKNINMEGGIKIGLVQADVSEIVFVNRTPATRLTINE